MENKIATAKERLFEWTIDDVLDGVRRISLVTAPATQSDFMLFSQDELKFKVTNTDKKVITGIAMRPNMHIPRRDADGELYYGFFSEETVTRASELFFRNGQNTNTTNLEHEFDVDGIYVFESWLVIDPESDKSKSLGMSDVRKGDWIVSMKVENDLIWNEFLKTGLIKGFSVEVKATENQVVNTQDELFACIEVILNSNASDEDKFNQISAEIK